MVGDAPGDRDAAEKNGVRFYPILVGHMRGELETPFRGSVSKTSCGKL